MGKFVASLVVIFFLFLSATSNAQNLITTVAGNGVTGSSGDGGQAVSATLNAPVSVAVDPSGNFFICETAGNRVRRVTPSGVISTYAGTGIAGYSGDGGPATSAMLSAPQGLATDGGGNLYVADTQNSRIRKVSPDGIITTVAGNGQAVISGDGGFPTSAGIGFPTAVAWDGRGNLFIASALTVRRVTTGSTTGIPPSTISTVFSLPPNLFSPAQVNGLATDVAGNLYVAVPQQATVWKVGPLFDGTATRFAGTGSTGSTGDGGAATSATLTLPFGLATDSPGNVYIGEQGTNRVRRVGADGVINTFAGSGTAGFSGDGGLATGAQLNQPTGLAVDGARNLLIADTGNQRVRKVAVIAACTYTLNPSTTNYSVAYTGGGFTVGVATSVGCSWTAASNVTWMTLSTASGSGLGPVIVTVGANNTGQTRSGTLTIAGYTITVAQSGTQACAFSIFPASELRSASASRLGSFNITTGSGCVWTALAGDSWITMNSAGGTGSGTVSFSVAANRTGTSRTTTIVVAGLPYTVTQAASLVLPGGLMTTLAGNGVPGFAGDNGPATAAQLRQATGIALDKYGSIYFADSDNHRVRKIDPAGVITTIAGTGSPGFGGDGGPAVTAQLNTPYSVAVDTDGTVYIADQKNYRIRKIGVDGNINTFAGTGVSGFSGDFGPATSATISDVYAIAIDTSTHNLYVTDRTNNRIRRITSSGIITTVAGNGRFGFSGDGGSAINASVAFPEGVAASSGNVFYIADSANNRIRRVDSSGIINTFAGNGAGGSTGDGGAATAATLALPRGVAVFPAATGGDNVYIADGDNSRIRKVSGGNISTVAGNGTAGFSGDGGPAISASLRSQRAITVDGDETIFIADTDNFRIRAASQAGCSYSLVPATLSVVSSGGTGGFQVLTQDGCAWTATTQASWIVFTNFSGRGSGAVFVAFTANTATTPRSGAITVADQTFTLNQDALPSTFSPTSFEPKLVKNLQPGFYILEATLAQGATGGAFGIEVIASAGQAAGGFNLGGTLPGGAAAPGFAAFLIDTPLTVTATLNSQTTPNTLLTVRFLDSSRRQVGTPVSGLSPVRLSQSLSPGFYIVEAYNAGPAPFNFQLGLSATYFVGGVDTGGYIGPGSVGFGAFFISDPQDVTMKLYGRSTYGPNGAGDLILTLRDSNRNVIATVTPP